MYVTLMHLGIIDQLLSSVSLSPKAIPLSGAYCKSLETSSVILPSSQLRTFSIKCDLFKAMLLTPRLVWDKFNLCLVGKTRVSRNKDETLKK
jgi:hypothetical protein